MAAPLCLCGWSRRYRADPFRRCRHGCYAAEGIDHDAARKLAETIIPLLGLTWAPDDGLPNCYIVDNEKKFLEDLGKEDPALLFKLRTECGWKGWPKVEQTVFEEVKEVENPITDNSIGTLSDESPRVLLDARTNALTKEINELTCPRRGRGTPALPAGRRGRAWRCIWFPAASHRNQCRDRRHRFAAWPLFRKQNAAGREHSLKILGFREGFRALLKGGVPPQQLSASVIALPWKMEDPTLEHREQTSFFPARPRTGKGNSSLRDAIVRPRN